MQSTRELALRVLYQIEYEEAYPNLALSKALSESELEERDRAFVSENVYGVLRNQIALDYVIRSYSSVRLKKIAPLILVLLRISAYQLLMMKLPHHAVCNEAVELAKKVGHSGSVRFVNALVRRIAREGMPPLPTARLDALSVQYSFPRWMIEKFSVDFGEEQLEELLKAFQRIPALTVRVNPLKTTKEYLLKALEAEGVKTSEGLFLDEAVRLAETGGVARLKSYQDGLFTVQDEGAMLIVRVLDPKCKEKIWDVCAAPGGKTTQIAELCKNDADILATDIHEHKIKLIESACNRLGISCVEAFAHDASKPLGEDKAFNRILVDAPCSGLGILGRKSDIRWMREEADLDALIKVQEEILEQASSNLALNGVLVYSTCTINPQENEGVIHSFLEKHPEFELEDVGDYLPDAIRSSNKTLTLLPHVHGCDGFFIARMRRVSK